MSNTSMTDQQLSKSNSETSIIDQFKEQAKLLAHLKPFNNVVIDTSNVNDIKPLYYSLLKS